MKVSREVLGVICLSGAHTEDEESLKIIENFLIALKGRKIGSLFQTNTRVRLVTRNVTHKTARGFQ